MSKGKRKLKVKVTPPLPICNTCPWKIWCAKLNFRTKNARGEIVKVCPVWWMVIGTLREKGILKDRPAAPLTMPPLSDEEARAIMDAARRKRRQGMGIAG